MGSFLSLIRKENSTRLQIATSTWSDDITLLLLIIIAQPCHWSTNFLLQHAHYFIIFFNSSQPAKSVNLYDRRWYIYIYLLPTVVGWCWGAPRPPPPPPEEALQNPSTQKTHQDWQRRKLRFIGRHTIRSTIHLKREAPPSATTLSTLAAWQRRILKKNNVERVGWRKMIWKRNADRTWLNNWLVQFLFPFFFFLHDKVDNNLLLLWLRL